MITACSRSLLVSPWRPFCAYLSTLHHQIKLAEVPEVCTTDEWNRVIQQSRLALHQYMKSHSTRIMRQQPVPIEAVVGRLRRASLDNEYLVNTFKYLIENRDETVSLLRWPGLVVLMLSQGIGNPFTADNFISKQLDDLIWTSQVVLAEIVNTLHCMLLFRKENVRTSLSRKKQRETAYQVDRLISHYFTSSSIYKFAGLKNPKVIYLLSEVLESFGKTKRSLSSDSVQTTNKHLWELDTFHSQGTLLANGCQATLELAGFDDRVQEMAFEFGHFFSLSIKANAEIQQLYDYQTAKSSYLSLSSFPMAIHLENYPETLKYIYEASEMDNLYFDQINSKLTSSSSLQEARHHLEQYISKTINIVKKFPCSGNPNMFDFIIKLVQTLNCIQK